MRTAAHIIETVGKLVKKYDTRDPYELCKCLEIKIHFYNLEKKLNGFFFYQSRQKNIVIDSNVNDVLERILIAHELGHAVLHTKIAMMKGFQEMEVLDGRSQDEDEANFFAAELLLEDKEVLECLSKYSFFETAKQLYVPASLLDYKFSLLHEKGELVSPMYIRKTKFLKDDLGDYDDANHVGPSGAGKTTLMHLLFRLWDCISGSITVDGIDIKDFDIDCLRGQISIVSQNIFLLNDTIYNNIVLGKEIADEELQHILVQAGLHEFINTLPNKLETVVGENGIKLSGGEKQRISIARALLKKNPILIFDEATSMLDNETEEKIISILLDSFKDTTIILIAHRLSTVKNANTIYVLNNGTIMEHGSHDQLLEQKGIYYHLIISNRSAERS